MCDGLSVMDDVKLHEGWILILLHFIHHMDICHWEYIENHR